MIDVFLIVSMLIILFIMVDLCMTGLSYNRSNDSPWGFFLIVLMMALLLFFL